VQVLDRKLVKNQYLGSVEIKFLFVLYRPRQETLLQRMRGGDNARERRYGGSSSIRVDRSVGGVLRCLKVTKSLSRPLGVE